MEDNTVLNFEQILKNRCTSKTPIIYQKNAINQSNYKPQDVLETVHSQIKAIQLADSVKKCKTNVRKSISFPAVSRVAPVYKEVPKPSKFETQCISDTQLINIIENVEALDAHKGITQEFDNTFIQTDMDKDIAHVKTDMSNNANIKDEEKHVSELFTHVRKERDKDTIVTNKEDDSTNFDHNKTELDKSIQLHQRQNLIDSPEVLSENKATIDTKIIDEVNINDIQENSVNINHNLNIEDVNNSIELFTENQTQFHEALDLDRSPSPVLNPKVRKKRTRSETPPSFTVPLDVFENFEKMYMPLIDLNAETKVVINSQILDKELCINMDNNTEIIKSQLSPIFDISSDELHIDKKDLKLFENGVQNKIIDIIDPVQDKTKNIDITDLEFNEVQTANIDNSKEKKVDMLKDEILFSSDEEEYVHKELEDLPLTCVLETSFYDEPGILEKTMYVGFQTASNKSIQIQTGSLERAQNILNNSKEFKLTELVDIYDKSLNLSKDIINDPKLNFACKDNEKQLVKTDKIDNNCGNEEDLIQTTQNKIEENEFIGFRTANNNKINISKKSKAKIRDVFKDIDLNEQFEDTATATVGRKLSGIDDLVNKGNVTPSTQLNYENDVQFDEKINDDLIIQEFENIEMSLEEIELKNSNETIFEGFKTASDKKIEISNSALQKVKNTFQDIDFIGTNDEFNDNEKLIIDKNDRKTINNENYNITDNKQRTSNTINKLKIPSTSKIFQGFKTANNKIINISEASMSKTSDIFKDIDNFDINIKDRLSNTNETLVDNSKLEGFKTASNKSGEIKKEALGLSKVLLNDFNGKLTHETHVPTNHVAVNETTNNNNNKANGNANENGPHNKGINNKNPVFDGFKTASNKRVKISEQSLAKSRKIFNEIEGETDAGQYSHKTNTDKYDNSVFKGFQTATNKIVKVSEQSLAKSKKTFESIDLENYSNKTGPCSKSIKVGNAVFKGYHTASNKPVKVSEQSLAKSIKILQDIDTEDNAVFKGFKTASNKPVKVSEQSLAKSRKILQDIDTENSLNENDSYSKVIKDDTAVFKDFQTASYKPVKVSEQSLAKSRKILQDINTESCLNENDSYSKVIKDDNAVFKGFQTASNKLVKVSEQSLAKSIKILQDINTESCLNEIDSYRKVIKDDNSVFKGFQTASNKPVKVSEQSLAKSRKILQDIDAESCLNKNNSYSKIMKDDTAVFKGFQTASNKPVNVSEQSLAKSRKIFETVNTEASNNTPFSNKAKDQNPVFKGFQTANNKSVDISENALLESKKVLNKIDEKNLSEHSTNNIEPNKRFRGFKTANHKEVLILESTLAQSKKIFKDFVEPISIYNETKVDGFTGFQTASNKNVKISKEAIEKTKHLFKDFDNCAIVSDQKFTEKSELKQMETEKTTGNLKEQSNKSKSNLNVFATASNKCVAITEESLKKSKDLLNNTTVQTVDTLKNIDSIINTQIMNNFEDNLCTEDFKSPQAKRSTSPILSCPRAKKRKFETPYKSIKDKVETIKDIIQVKNQTYFDEDYKKNKILKLKDLKVTKNKSVDLYITDFNINNILKFEFTKERNDLIDGTLTINGLKRLFIDGVDEKIIPEGWLDIHVKLIIWKLLSYEVKYDFTCTAKQVLDQLKFRYDKELFRVERSALRKIFEKDDVPSKTMILCVADVYVNGESVSNVTTTDNIELLLTDGWYFIKATIDKMLSKLVFDRKIVVGCKLATNGAELLNCEQGVAPWEDTSSIRLKLSYNSTRPAHWDARLGYCQSAILSHLSTVKLDGGKICKLRVFVTRVYPLLYVEKFEDGSTVTRSERLEHLHQIKYETDREAVLEKIYEEVQKELSDQESQDSENYIETDSKRKVYDSGSQIAKMMKKSKDPMEFRAQLTTSQIQLLQDHTSKYRDKMLSVIQDKMRSKLGDRNVVPLARGKVADVDVKNGKIVVTTGMLSIWKPNDAILELVKENAWIEVMNVIPTAMRYSEIQISAGRQSVFRHSKRKVDPDLLSHLEKLKRKVYKIEEFTKKSITDNEIDAVGLIFLIEPSNRDFDSTKQFQNVYLADENKNMICINFWGGIKKFGFHNVIDTGQIIYCANLQRRAGNTRKNIPQFRVTEFTSITKTPKNSIAREIIDELNKKLEINREKFCEDCAAIQNNYTALKCFDENSPYRLNKSDYNISKNKQFIETPLRQKEEFNLTGLDFESTFRQTDTQLSPKTLQRKKKVNERIAKLKMYGEPPPLSPINIVNKSKNATNSYKSPLLSNNNDTSVQRNVTRGKKIVEMCSDVTESTSPILNRTYVKRSNVNPIKLDFSKNSLVSKEADHFSEDFDASPPLSLD